jgi:RNA polymerase sigma-70 factor (ECF subfamily)
MNDDRQQLRDWFSNGVEENLDALFGAAWQLTRNRADADDLVAETVVKAWAAIRSLEDRGRFRPWLFRILRNSYFSLYRKKAVRPMERSLDEAFVDEGSQDVASYLAEQSPDFLQWWANPESECINTLLREQIMAAIDRLPTAFRVTVTLVNVEGLTYDEAAEVLGVPAGTIRSRMKRGRTLLQKSLWRQALDAGLEHRGHTREIAK